MWLIREKIAGPQRFPLQRFLEEIIAVEKSQTNRPWQVYKTVGYGSEICALDDRVQASDSGVSVQSSFLLGLAKNPNQWFYDLDCYDATTDIRFGLLDSGALFIDGDAEMVRMIVEKFHDVSQTTG